MATEAATEATTDETTEAPSPKSPLVTVAKIGAFVVVILTVEALIGFLLIPSADDVSAMAQARYAANEATADPVAEMADETTGEPTAEVDLENYSVTSYQPLTNTTLRIDFHLYATVAVSQKDEFNTLFNENKHRIREQVIVTLRSSEITDLTDAGLGLIKRKVHDKLNRTLGKSLVKTVIVSDFSFVEQ